MHWNHLPVGLKLLAGFGLVLGLLVLVSFKAVDSTDRLTHHLNRTVESMEHLAELKAREADHLQWASDVSQGVIQNDMATVTAQVDPTLCQFGMWYYGPSRQEIIQHHAELAMPLASLEQPHNAMHATLAEMRARVAADGEEAMPAVREIFLGKTLPALRAFRERMHETSAMVEVLSRRAEAEAKADGEANLRHIRILTALALAMGVVLALAISRAITRPLSRVVAAADRIALGDLEPELADAARKDELGALARAFQRMTQALRGLSQAMGDIASGDLRREAAPRSDVDAMGQAMRTMVVNLRELTRQIQQAMNTMGASINQISITTAELSSSAAETAAAVSETTTTVEEVRQTASVAHQKARGVAERSKDAVRVALEGRNATEAVLEAMRQIKEKMDFIAQSIVTLSDKSQRIGDIILAVNDLADQSNILAVNASIEAARAGEEGKGFAVVAREIRSLAEQSKQSTSEVRGILDEIRKATSAAVMTTEEGGKAVTRGEVQVAQAALSIQSLVETASKDSQAAAQIAASSQEELTGMEQVAQAMESIHQATEQNLESARQLDQSLHAMARLAGELTELLTRYKL